MNIAYYIPVTLYSIAYTQYNLTLSNKVNISLTDQEFGKKLLIL